MRFCDVCQVGSLISNPAEYLQEWTTDNDAGVIMDLHVCEKHMIRTIDKEMIAKGYILTLKRIYA